jgi:hypothetical protein
MFIGASSFSTGASVSTFLAARIPTIPQNAEATTAKIMPEVTAEKSDLEGIARGIKL